MPDILEIVDFKDTSLDAEHLKNSFPDYDVYILLLSVYLLESKCMVSNKCLKLAL